MDMIIFSRRYSDGTMESGNKKDLMKFKISRDGNLMLDDTVLRGVLNSSIQSNFSDLLNNRAELTIRMLVDPGIVDHADK